MKKIYLLCIILSLLNSVFISTTIASPSDAQSQFYPVRERLLVQSLNGTWKFKLFEGLTVPAEYTDWKNPAFDVGPWDNIAVPGNWETQGFKIPEYGRDLGEYTGLYRTSFKYNPAWKSKNVILRFDGVHFGYECYINGTKAGEHGSAFNMCQFDITPFLNMESDNILCVKVSSRSFGWLFDTNDCWSLVGITRDVELFALDNVYLEDMTFVSEVTPESDAIVKVRVDVNRFRENRSAYKLNISLSDPLNNHILDFSRPIDPNVKVYDFEGILRQPKLWTAETPNLYRIEVCIVDDKGYVVQRINERIGVRSVYVDGFDLKVNHKPVLLRGVCVNEIDPQLGRALTYKERRKQLEKMKAANINFIRTAHYPFGPDFLQLCDEMGFYVCNEIPFGSRGAENLEKEEYLPELIERADATLRRDKNRPSVIIWSLGNENPYTPIVEKVLEYVSIKDPGRPRGLPQKTGDFMKFTKNPSPNVDIIMGHYLSDSRISEAVKNTSKPIIHTEYAHSLGLAFEDLEAKYSRILNEEKVVGGSIWCWSDQTVMTLGDNQKNKILKSVWIDSMRFMDSYGRSEVAEGKREVWKEAADGIVYGDGYPQEDFYEVRKVYSPVIINTDKLNAKSGASNVFDLDIESRFDFISLHGYKIDWKVCNVRRILESGEVWLQTPAGMQDKVSMHVDLPENVDFNDLMLSMEILDPSGKSIYEKTLPIEIIGHSKDYRSLVEVLPEAKKSKNRISKTMASVGADDVHFELTGKGVLKIKDGKDRQIIETPLYLRVGRPLSITLDYLAQKDTFYWNPYILTPVIEGFETSEQKDGVQIRLACRWNRIEKPEEYVSGIVVVDMRSNGTVNLDYDIIPSENASGNFLECGLLLKLNPSFDVFRWLGAGPFSYTPGKTAYNERSCWAVHKDDIRFAGNRGLVDIAVITDQQRGVGLWSENGYVGIENINGSIHVSQNALVTGYGSKFTEPGNRIPMNDLKSIKGSFVLFVDQPEKPVTFFDLIFKSDKSYPTVVPEQPYMKSYGR